MARYSGVHPPLLARFTSAPRSIRYAAKLVVAILRRDEQGAPAVSGDLVDVGSRIQQDLDGIEIVGADRIDQRRQSAAIFDGASCPPPPKPPAAAAASSP